MITIELINFRKLINNAEHKFKEIAFSIHCSTIPFILLSYFAETLQKNIRTPHNEISINFDHLMQHKDVAIIFLILFFVDDIYRTMSLP